MRVPVRVGSLPLAPRKDSAPRWFGEVPGKPFLRIPTAHLARPPPPVFEASAPAEEEIAGTCSAVLRGKFWIGDSYCYYPVCPLPPCGSCGSELLKVAGSGTSHCPGCLWPPEDSESDNGGSGDEDGEGATLEATGEWAKPTKGTCVQRSVIYDAGTAASSTVELLPAALFKHLYLAPCARGHL